jgi:hypothetical protein
MSSIKTDVKSTHSDALAVAVQFASYIAVLAAVVSLRGETNNRSTAGVWYGNGWVCRNVTIKIKLPHY